MDRTASPPEQSLYAQWREAADESHFFELGLARKALSPEGTPASRDEWIEALRLRAIANQLYRLFMSDMDSKARSLSEWRTFGRRAIMLGPESGRSFMAPGTAHRP
jgi:hypothetical protein